MCFLSDLDSIRLQGVEVPNPTDRGSDSRRPRPEHKTSLLQEFSQQARALFVPAICTQTSDVLKGLQVCQLELCALKFDQRRKGKHRTP